MKKVKRHKVDNKKVQNTWSDSQMENPESLTFFFYDVRFGKFLKSTYIFKQYIL